MKNQTEARKPVGRIPVKKGFKHKKLIIIIAVLLTVGIAAILLLPNLLMSNVTSTRIITYNDDEITYGNVNTTI